MKTYKNIFVQVVAFDNLMLAHYHASKGKKHRDEVLIFEQRKAEYCIILGNRLVKQTYKVGSYRIFWIRRPVLRMAMALHYLTALCSGVSTKLYFPYSIKALFRIAMRAARAKGRTRRWINCNTGCGRQTEAVRPIR